MSVDVEKTGEQRGLAEIDNARVGWNSDFAPADRLDVIAGMVDALNMRVRQQGRPFLGICVGMQLMAERGREFEVTEGLGWIAGEVDRIMPSLYTARSLRLLASRYSEASESV